MFEASFFCCSSFKVFIELILSRVESRENDNQTTKGILCAAICKLQPVITCNGVLESSQSFWKAQYFKKNKKIFIKKALVKFQFLSTEWLVILTLFHHHFWQNWHCWFLQNVCGQEVYAHKWNLSPRDTCSQQQLCRNNQLQEYQSACNIVFNQIYIVLIYHYHQDLFYCWGRPL